MQLLNIMQVLDNELETRCVAVSVGGTAMTLHGVKPGTADIDFTIREGYGDFVRAVALTADQIQVRIDSWIDGEVYLNTLPSDYFARSTHETSFNHIEIWSLCLIDVIVTKIGRLNRNDRNDISSILASTQISGMDVVRRVRQMSYDGLRATYWDNLCEVMKIHFGMNPDDFE